MPYIVQHFPVTYLGMGAISTTLLTTATNLPISLPFESIFFMAAAGATVSEPRM
jgi:hypothetical protein